MSGVQPTDVAPRRARVAELHAQGFGYQRIAGELGCGKTTIARDVRALALTPHATGRPAQLPKPEERVCELDGCDVRFTPRAYQVVRGYGRFCSLAHANRGKTYERKAVVWRNCLQCNKKFWRWQTVAEKQGAMGGLARFCSHECVGKYRWTHESGVYAQPLETYLREIGQWSGPATRKWAGKRNGHKGGAHGFKGAAYGVLGKEHGMESRFSNVGRESKSTPEQKQQVLALDKKGRSGRDIARIVYGDVNLRDRVRRILNG